MCRFCLCESSPGDELISPCSCRGDQKYVHLSCLRRWQRAILIEQPTHPDHYEEDIRREVCRVCSQRFDPPPVSREAMYLGFTGIELASLVRPGCLIVASASASEEMADACAASALLLNDIQRASGHLHPEFEILKHWIGSAMCIVSVDSDGDPLEDGIRAVNLTRPMVFEGEELGTVAPLYALETFPAVQVHHFHGGPCEVGHPTCMAALLATSEEGGTLDRLEGELGVHRVGGAHGLVWIVGDIESVAAAVDADRDALDTAQPFPTGASYSLDGTADITSVLFNECRKASRRISIFWGYAGWNRTQLHGEFARGGWGCCGAELLDVFPNAVKERALRTFIEGAEEAEQAKLGGQDPAPSSLADQANALELMLSAARVVGEGPGEAYARIQRSDRLVYAAENEMSTVRTVARAAALAAGAAQSDEVRAVAAQLARQQNELREAVAMRHALRDAAAAAAAAAGDAEDDAEDDTEEDSTGSVEEAVEEEAVEDVADAAATTPMGEDMADAAAHLFRFGFAFQNLAQ